MGLKQLKYIHITLASILTLSVAGLWQYDKLIDSTYWLIMTAVTWATLLFYSFQKTYLLQSISFTIALISGVYGFSTQTYSYYPWLNALYSTFRLFLLDVDTVFNAEGNKYVNLPLSVEIARWSAAFYTISTISLLFFRYFWQTIKVNWFVFRGKHILIFGYNAHSAILLENLTKDRHRVVVVEDKLSDEQRNQIDQLGAAYFPGSSQDNTTLKRISLLSSKYIVLMHMDDSRNLDDYLSIRSHVDQNIINETIQLIIHIENKKTEQILENITRNDVKSNFITKLRTRFYNTYQLHAEQLLEKHPLHQGYESRLRKPDGDPLHLLFIGFGKMNQHLAYQALHRTHYISADKTKITVFDREIEKVKKEWDYIAPLSDKVAELHFNSIDLDKEKIDDQLASIEKPTHVFVSLYDDYLDMMEGLQLTYCLKDVPIFIKMQDNRLVSNWLHENDNDYAKVQRYTFLREVLTYESVLEGRHQNIAKDAHEKYRAFNRDRNKPEGPPWESLDEFKRESNRYQMLHNETKLMLLGLKPTNQTVGKLLTPEDYKDFVSPLAETLAKVEKNRWNAFYYLRGWDVLPLEQVTPKYKDDMDRKLHSCLVSWENLDKVSEKANIDFKLYDFETVYNLIYYYKAQKINITKEVN